MPPRSPRLALAGATDAGTTREYNEDGFLLFEPQGVAVVLDGMGGASSGHYAVERISDVLRARFGAPAGPATGDDEACGDERELVAALQAANADLFAWCERTMSMRGLGAAALALAPAGGELVCLAHAGDARAYRVRDEGLEPLTEEHNLVYEYRNAAGVFVTAEQLAELARSYPNVITRALGMQARVMIDTRLERVVPGDTLLLCTDGLYHALPDAEIHAVLRETLPHLARACDALIRRANARGTRDNVTAVLARVERVG